MFRAFLVELFKNKNFAITCFLAGIVLILTAAGHGWAKISYTITDPFWIYFLAILGFIFMVIGLILGVRDLNAPQRLPNKSGLQKPALQPGLIYNDFQSPKGPYFISTRETSPNKEIPSIPAEFLEKSKATFSLWVNILPDIRKIKSTPRYIFSHTSDKSNGDHPDAFCLCHANDSPN